MAKAKKAAKAAPKAAKKDDNGKIYAIVAHIGIIGWIIALILNKDKDPLASFYLRQTLIIYLAYLVCIPLFIIIIGYLLALVLFVFWILSLIGSINGEQKEVPLIGGLGQKWFKGL